MWATATAGLYGPAVSSQSIVHHDGHYGSHGAYGAYDAPALGYYNDPVVHAPLAYAAPLAYSGHYDGHDEYVSKYIHELKSWSHIS